MSQQADIIELFKLLEEENKDPTLQAVLAALEKGDHASVDLLSTLDIAGATEKLKLVTDTIPALFMRSTFDVDCSREVMKLGLINLLEGYLISDGEMETELYKQVHAYIMDSMPTLGLFKGLIDRLN